MKALDGDDAHDGLQSQRVSTAQHASITGVHSARLRLALLLLVPVVHLRLGAQGFGLRSNPGARATQVGGCGTGARLKPVLRIASGLRLRQRDVESNSRGRSSSSYCCSQDSLIGDTQQRFSADVTAG